MNESVMKCNIERDHLARVIYRAGDGGGVQGGGPLGTLSEKAITPHTNLYHFFVIGRYIEAEDDYEILESIGNFPIQLPGMKSHSVAVGRLSWYAKSKYTVFRMNDPDYVVLGERAVGMASKFGRRPYDYRLYLKMFAWAAGYFSKEIATGHIPPRAVPTDRIPYRSDHDFICIELYFAVWNLVGRRIRAHGHAPMPAEVINAVKRGTLVIIDYHNGNKSAWREPRGPVNLSWVDLGRAAEKIRPGELLALGSDGLVRKVREPLTPPEASGIVSDARKTAEEKGLQQREPSEVYEVAMNKRAMTPGLALTGRQWGQSRNRVHYYAQPYGYPIRVCDWVAAMRFVLPRPRERGPDMLKLLDGPVAGVYLVKRAPSFLRAVIDAKTNEKDVLDALEDTPKDSEDVFVYERQGEAGWIHLLMSPWSKSGFYASGEYKLRDDIDGRLVRANESWRVWVASQVKGPVNMETGAIQ